MRRKTLIEFVHEAKEIHGVKYDYSIVNYRDAKQKICIKCLKCGNNFYQTPTNHLNGKGCNNCANEIRAFKKRKPLSKFIIEANQIHNGKYDYSLVNYSNKNTKIQIICKNCNQTFMQSVHNHLAGNGCPVCAISSISKLEQEWLDSLNIPKDSRQILIKIENRTFKVDALLANTVYEFNGDYWHGNPRAYDLNSINPQTKTTFGFLYSKTVFKAQTLIKAGYKVVSMWESDWKRIKDKNERKCS